MLCGRAGRYVRGVKLRNPLKFGRPQVAFLHDVVMAAASFWISLYLGSATAFSSTTDRVVFQGIAVFAAVAAVVFVSMRLYAGVWRYASLSDLMAILKAVSITVLMYLALMFLMTRLDAYPRSTLVINWFVLAALLGGPRFFYRLSKDRRLPCALARLARGARPTARGPAACRCCWWARATPPSCSSAPSTWRPARTIASSASWTKRARGSGATSTACDVLGGARRHPARDRAAAPATASAPQRMVLTKDNIDGAPGARASGRSPTRRA